jgi:hypothetical protein
VEWWCSIPGEVGHVERRCRVQPRHPDLSRPHKAVGFLEHHHPPQAQQVALDVVSPDMLAQCNAFDAAYAAVKGAEAASATEIREVLAAVKPSINADESAIQALAAKTGSRHAGASTFCDAGRLLQRRRGRGQRVGAERGPSLGTGAARARSAYWGYGHDRAAPGARRPQRAAGRASQARAGGRRGCRSLAG